MAAEESYYTVLGVRSDSSLDEIRRAYRRLAMQWHPDRWASTPSLLGEANRKFQKIQEAYSVLSDPAKRSVYDAGLYDPTDEYDEGFCDFMQEMLDLMAQVKEEKFFTHFYVVALLSTTILLLTTWIYAHETAPLISKLVSSPHYLAEMVIYGGILVASGGTDLTIWLLHIFVVANLVLAAVETHRWYSRKFDNYPSDRYAVIPYVY